MLGLIAGATAGAVWAGYHTMAPRSQLYGRTFIGPAARGKSIAFTFDDGPNDPYTLQLLDVLAKHGAKATFFMIGQFVDRRPDIVREVVQAGHAVGNHTYSHPNLIFRSKWQLQDEINRCERALRDAIGDRQGRLFRPPFGGRRPATIRTVRQAGLHPILWSVTGWDWNADPAATIERKVSAQIRGGDVVLLHDGSHLRLGGDRLQTVKATDALLARYQREGYRFPTVLEMMEAG
jgi:peptidoglycan/xylan/chitin deacetylase (PgdA/CDA1 family)